MFPKCGEAERSFVDLGNYHDATPSGSALILSAKSPMAAQWGNVTMMLVQITTLRILKTLRVSCGSFQATKHAYGLTVDHAYIQGTKYLDNSQSSLSGRTPRSIYHLPYRRISHRLRLFLKLSCPVYRYSALAAVNSATFDYEALDLLAGSRSVSMNMLHNAMMRCWPSLAQVRARALPCWHLVPLCLSSTCASQSSSLNRVQPLYDRFSRPIALFRGYRDAIGLNCRSNH